MATVYTSTLATVNDIAQVGVGAASTVGIKITGTWAGVITFYGSRDKGVTFDAINVAQLVNGAYSTTEVGTTTANGTYVVQAAGLTHIQAKLTTATSGSATVVLTPSRSPLVRNTVVTKEAATGTVIQTTTSAVTVAAAGSLLLGLQIHTALVGTATIAGFVDDTGTARSYVLPVGSVGKYLDNVALRVPNALTITLSSASDAAKVIVYSTAA